LPTTDHETTALQLQLHPDNGCSGIVFSYLLSQLCLLWCLTVTMYTIITIINSSPHYTSQQLKTALLDIALNWLRTFSILLVSTFRQFITCSYTHTHTQVS